MEKVVIKAARTDNGYCCACDIIPGWIVTYTGDIDGFKDYVKESIDFWLEGRREKGEKYPAVFDKDYELVYDFDIATLLDYYRGVFSFSALQSITGINQKQLAHYASGVSKPRPQQVRKIKVGLRKLAKDIEMVTV
ncbi:MAG: hypothetical protein PUF37_05815 [Prevotellaceae bacterium]|nr:hypothetical protein [Prevotellaceae bacterium]